MKLRRPAPRAPGSAGTQTSTASDPTNRTRRTLIVTGAILLGVGVVVQIVGLLLMGNLMDRMFGDFNPRFSSMLGIMGFMMAGGTAFLAGLVLLIYGLLRPIATFTAESTAPAFRTTAAAVTQGVQTGLQTGGVASPAVKIRCRSCGHLESEDAKHCSNCRSVL